LIFAEKANYTITRMCRLLEVDRRRYYEWVRYRDREPSARECRLVELTQKIVASHEASGGTYGAPRVHADLVEAGEKVSVKTVGKLMRQAGIAGISPRSWRTTTTIPGVNPFPVGDLVGRRFDQGMKDTIWLSDITYLRTGQGWAYCCVVTDGHTRRVLGRKITDHMRADLVEDTLTQAVTLRGELPDRIVFHADRGCQYTSEQIALVAQGFKLLRSMGATGVCWDNAQVESFWSTLKNEYYHRHVFTTIEQARQGVYTWIDAWYNTQRRHSKIGHQSPLQYEQQLATTASIQTR
jgi:transposase InsO family protein